MDATPLTINSPVKDFVTSDINRSALLRQLQIDFCCGGEKPLIEACREKNLDPHAILQLLLHGAPAGAAPATPDLANASLSEIVDHIEKVHHAYIKTQAPRLSQMVQKVMASHLTNHPELKRLEYLFMALRNDLESHLMKEERVLFPMFRQMDAGAADDGFHCGPVSNPITVMRMEHDRAGAFLEEIKKVSNNYTLPADGCGSYRLMLEELKAFADDLHLHVHKENNILFPRALDN